MRLLLLPFLLCLGLPVFAQYKVGLKLNPGLAWYRSAQMGDATEKLNELNPSVTYDNRSVNGFHFGFGGYAEKIQSSKLMFVSELTFNYQNTPYFISYDQDLRDASGTGDRTQVKYDTHIKGFYLSLPIMAKYMILTRQKIYGIGGFAFNLMLTPKIISRADTTYTSYNLNQIITTPNVVNTQTEAKLDAAGKFNVQFALGLGKSFRFAGRTMDLELRYQVPLLRTELYSSDAAMNNNPFFSKDGVANIQTTTGVNIDDFRNGTFMFSIRYQLKYIAGKDEE